LWKHFLEDLNEKGVESWEASPEQLFLPLRLGRYPWNHDLAYVSTESANPISLIYMCGVLERRNR